MAGRDIRSGGGGVVIGSGGIASGAGGNITIVNASPQAPAPARAASPAPRPTPGAPIDVFLSYAHEDRSRIDPIVAALGALCIDCWMDARLTPGELFADTIGAELAACRAHIVAWSPRSVVSQWVRAEADVGRQRGTLVPVRVAPCEIPLPFSIFHATDLSHWNGRQDDTAWRGIIAALAEKLERPGLGELAGLVQVRDGPGVRAWALRHPADPFVARRLR